MDGLRVAARFVAFVYFLNRDNGPMSPEEAGRLARDKWPGFLPYAAKGLGRLLTLGPHGAREPRPEARFARNLPDQQETNGDGS